MIMKKILFTGCLVLATAATSVAQTYADVAKATTETPFSMGIVVSGGGTGINFTAPALRLRYFVTDNIAARVQLGFLSSPFAETNRFYENPDGTGGEGIQEINRSGWMAQVGGEYHLAGTQKLSPYFYLGVNFGAGGETETWEEFDGASYDEDYLSYESTSSQSRFGVDFGAGMEFYFVENVYIGLELGLGYSSHTYNDMESSSEINFGGTINTSKGVTAGSKESYFGTQAAFRLGWRF
jgi:opacity protein-like surface antigen